MNRPLLLLALGLLLVGASFRVQAAGGEAARSLEILGRVEDSGHRLKRLTKWCQAWIRAVESGPTQSTKGLRDVDLTMLGEDLQVRLDRFQGDMRELKAELKYVPLSKEVDRAGQLDTCDRLVRLAEDLKVLPRTFLLKLKRRARGK